MQNKKSANKFGKMQTNLINDHNAFNYASAKLTPLFDSTSWISSDDTLELRNNNNNNNNFNHLNTKNLIQSSQIHLKHSMSDDEVAYNATIHDDRKKEDGNHTIYPLFNGLKESVSANITKRKRKKGRSNSAIISGNNDKYHHKWKTLKREYKLQSDKVSII